MAKRLELTPKITAAIEKSTGGSVDPSKVAVFEWVAATGLPLSKRGTLFDKGRISDATFQEMAAFLNDGGFVPLHTLHQQGYELPVGRLLTGEFVSDNGVSQLRVLAMIPETETELLGKIEGGAIDEASIGLRTKHITCSECGFDYLGKDATFDNLWSCTCPDGHTIGENGVYANLTGMDRFLEMSFVSLGAAQGAKSVSREKSLLSETDYKQILQASGHDPILSLFASPTHPTKTPKEPEMDVTKLVDDLTTAKASLISTQGNLTASEEKIKALDAEKVTLTEKVTELTAKVATLEAGDAAKLTQELEAAKAGTQKALAFVRAEADRLAVACGEAKLADDATLEALTASIEASRTKLAANLPVGGASASQGSGTQATVASAASSFKTRK